jgi:PII-like signaling protein
MRVSVLGEISASLIARHGADSLRQQTESNLMSQRNHQVVAREVGMIRVYLKPSDKRKEPGWRGFLTARPLYRELIDAAKQEGVMNAHAHHTHYGYSNRGHVQAQVAEIGNPELTICVELIATKDQLELFCRTHGEMLREKVIVYKLIEHWDIRDAILEEPKTDVLSTVNVTVRSTLS